MQSQPLHPQAHMAPRPSFEIAVPARRPGNGPLAAPVRALSVDDALQFSPFASPINYGLG